MSSSPAGWVTCAELTASILSEANELLLSDDPVSKIGSDVTGGIVSGVTDGVVFTLKGLAVSRSIG